MTVKNIPPDSPPPTAVILPGPAGEARERRRPALHRLQVGFALAALAITLAVLYLMQGVIGAFVLGTFLAFLMTPAVDWLSRHGVPRVAAILGILLVVMGLIALMIALFLPLLTTEAGQLRTQAPGIAAEAQRRLTSIQSISVMGTPVDLSGLTSQLQTHINEFLLGQFGNALGIGLQAVSTLAQLFLLLIVAFLVAYEAGGITSVVRKLVPVTWRGEFDLIWIDIKRMLYAYIRGQLLMAALIGALSGIAVAVLGLPFAFALGVLAGVTALVPYVGPLLGAIPAVLIALSISPGRALVVAVVYVVISNVILNFVYPKVVGGAVRLPALLVIVSFIAGFAMGGILGMFVAVPVAAVFRILFDHLYPPIYEAA